MTLNEYLVKNETIDSLRKEKMISVVPYGEWEEERKSNFCPQCREESEHQEEKQYPIDELYFVYDGRRLCTNHTIVFLTDIYQLKTDEKNDYFEMTFGNDEFGNKTEISTRNWGRLLAVRQQDAEGILTNESTAITMKQLTLFFRLYKRQFPSEFGNFMRMLDRDIAD